MMRLKYIIKAIEEQYKSGDYPKYIITQISEGTEKFKEYKKEYGTIEEKIVSNLKSKEQDEQTKQDLWKIELLHSKLEEGEKQLDTVNEQLETIKDWDKLSRSQKRRFLENVYDCRDFTMDRWNNMDDLIRDIRKINKENDNGVSDLDYLSCTNELLQPLYKIDNNLQRITEKYSFD